MVGHVSLGGEYDVELREGLAIARLVEWQKWCLCAKEEGDSIVKGLLLEAVVDQMVAGSLVESVFLLI